MFRQTLYIRFDERQLHLTDLNTGRQYQERALVAIRQDGDHPTVQAIGQEAELYRGRESYHLVAPFAHPRLVLDDFVVAEKLLQHAIRSLYRGSMFRPSPTVLLHPLRSLEGDLNDIEQRALRELAAGAGAREVMLWQGPVLSSQEVMREIKRQRGRPVQTPLWQWGFIGVLVLALVAGLLAAS